MDQDSERIFVAAMLKSMIEAGQLPLEASPEAAYERLRALAKVSRGLYREMWPEAPTRTPPASPPQRAAQSARGPAAARPSGGSEFPEAFWHERVKLLKKSHPPDGPTWKELIATPKGRKDLEWMANGAPGKDGTLILGDDGKWAQANRKVRERAAACLDYHDQMSEGYDGGGGYPVEETPF